MNIIESTIFSQTKKNQKTINGAKILISALLLFIFLILYIELHAFGILVKIYFLLGYIILLSCLRYFFEKVYNYYKYINTFIDIVGILILIKLSLGISEGHTYSLYFMPLLLSIIIISSLGFQKFYTITFGFFASIMMGYLLYYDGIFHAYGILVLFLFILSYLACVYNVFHLHHTVNHISHLQQLEKFTDSDLLEKIKQSPDILSQKGVKKELVIFFLDIKGFSRLSEKLGPEEIFAKLNTYLGRFATIIEKNNGIVDKYIGDCIMGYFEKETMIQDSYQSAIEIQKAIIDLNTNQKYQIGVGIGMHFGEVFSGSLGNETRLDFTIIGDNVNITSRLESLTRTLKSDIVVSKDYYKKITFSNRFKPAGLHELKGKDNTIEVYTL